MKLWRNSKLKQDLIPVLVILITAVFAVYYPAMLSGIHTVDDPGIYSLYSSSPPLLKILLPGNGYYYRPLIELSYWLDNKFWDMSPAVMHLENVIMHCCNSILVFFLAFRFSNNCNNKTYLLPLLASLLFAVHPLNVEAVAWIAGRTDPLLTLFVLSACFIWLKWIEKPNLFDFILAVVLFVCALLTKETALAAYAVAFFMVLTWPGTALFRERLKMAGYLICPVFLLFIFILYFRSSINSLSKLCALGDIHFGKMIWDGLIACGFYVKKIIFPVPLSFAITDVPPIYGLIGTLLFPTLFFIFKNNRQAGIFLFSALLLVLPAVFVAVTKIAWTPFAERYMYLPLAFCTIGFSILIQSNFNKEKRFFQILIICLLVGFTAISIHRVKLWSNKLLFYRDAIEKSPTFGSLYNELGGILLKNGEINSADEAFKNAERLNKRTSMHLMIKANLMIVQHAKGNYIGVRNNFFQLFKDKNEAPADFLELLYKADGQRMNLLYGTDKILLAEDLLDTLNMLNIKRYDPFWLYRSGQISLIIGDETKAANFFRRSYIDAPADAHYRGAIVTYLQKMKSK